MKEGDYFQTGRLTVANTTSAVDTRRIRRWRRRRFMSRPGALSRSTFTTMNESVPLPLYFLTLSLPLNASHRVQSHSAHCNSSRATSHIIASNNSSFSFLLGNLLLSVHNRIFFIDKKYAKSVIIVKALKKWLTEKETA